MADALAQLGLIKMMGKAGPETFLSRKKKGYNKNFGCSFLRLKLIFFSPFLLFLGAAIASDNRACMDQMMEEVRCSWRKSKVFLEKPQSLPRISWAAAVAPFAAA
jgi:hypothetical protein